MIRHSKSFFISIVVHLTLLVMVIYTWQDYAKKPKEICEKKVCIKLCDVECITDVKIPKKLQQTKKKRAR